jgi:uncharacterized protein (UPF0335 family)
MSDARLKSLAERINRLMDDRDAIGGDIRDIYSEAKSAGYIPKALRKTIARMRADQSDLAEQDTLVELYEAALGRVGRAMAAVRAGSTLDAAAEANGIHRATLARARAVAKSSENATDAHDPATGEITVEGGAPNPARGGEASADERAASVLPSPPIAEPDLTFPSFLDRRVA